MPGSQGPERTRIAADPDVAAAGWWQTSVMASARDFLVSRPWWPSRPRPYVEQAATGYLLILFTLGTLVAAQVYVAYRDASILAMLDWPIFVFLIWATVGPLLARARAHQLSGRS